jgi:hypothetical protein
MSPPIDNPTSAKRGGAAARMRAAMAVMLSSRIWSATVTGANRQGAGNLLGLEPRRAAQSRDEDGRERLVHRMSFFTLRSASTCDFAVEGRKN